MNRVCLRAVLVVATLALAGCTSMTGVGGSSSYACQAPEGVTCNSVSGVYANAIVDNLPGRNARAVAAAPKKLDGALSGGLSAAEPATDRPDELRSRPRVLRLWFKPWEDADGDLFGQGYVYVQIDVGQWRIDHVQRRARDAFAPVRPPSAQSNKDAVLEPQSRSVPPLPPVASDPRQTPRPAVSQNATD